MVLPLYLAMTAAEIRAKNALPSKIGWMACHFSPYGTGLSNCPADLPSGAMLIVNDRTPIHGHDRTLIAEQLEELIATFHCDALLLDFQRPDRDETTALISKLVEALPCPVGVSDLYARDVSCPVFLPPPPLDTPLETYLHPWQSREIWLEAAMDGMVITLTERGSNAAPLSYPNISKNGHADEALHCHYRIDLDPEPRFTLFRTSDDLLNLLDEAAQLGVTRAVGLYQELDAWYEEL